MRKKKPVDNPTDILSDIINNETFEQHEDRNNGWGEVDVLLQNWQTDVLNPREEPQPVKIEPVADKILDAVLTPPNPEKTEPRVKSKLKTKIRKKTPQPLQEPQKEEKKKTVVLKKEPFLFRKKSSGNDPDLKNLRFRTDSEQGLRPALSPDKSHKENSAPCRICGTYVPCDQLLDSMYCSTDCCRVYSLCDMCRRPYEKDHQGQRFCSNPACRMRYIRKPGIRKIEYVLIEE